MVCKKTLISKNQYHASTTKVQNISTFKYKSKKFDLTVLYISSLDKKSLDVYIYIKCKLHLFKDLKINIPIGNNISYAKSFLINFVNASAHIINYRVNIVINTRHHFEFLKHRVIINIANFILPKSEVLVLF